MKISVFTGRQVSQPERLEHVKTAADIAAEHAADILILPGYSFGTEKVEPVTVKQIVNKTKVPIFTEIISNAEKIGNQSFLYEVAGKQKGPFIQRFSDSDNVNEYKVNQVVHEFNTNQRIITIKEKKIGVLLCGENNILTNPAGKNYAAEPRYSSIYWPFIYDILINPAHTIMGEWHLLQKRFAYFSRSGRVLIFCTNNTNKTDAWLSSLCVYANGREILNGDLEVSDESSIKIFKEKDWRLATIEVK